MISPATITAAMVTQLKAIAALVTALGSANNIAAHNESGSLAEAIRNLKAKEVLVAWQQTIPGESSAMEMWLHQASIFFRVIGDPAPVLTVILTGIPAGQAVAFHRLQLTAGLLPSTTPSTYRRQLPISETAAVDYIEIQFNYGDYDRP